MNIITSYRTDIDDLPWILLKIQTCWDGWVCAFYSCISIACSFHPFSKDFHLNSHTSTFLQKVQTVKCKLSLNSFSFRRVHICDRRGLGFRGRSPQVWFQKKSNETIKNTNCLILFNVKTFTYVWSTDLHHLLGSRKVYAALFSVLTTLKRKRTSQSKESTRDLPPSIIKASRSHCCAKQQCSAHWGTPTSCSFIMS